MATMRAKCKWVRTPGGGVKRRIDLGDGQMIDSIYEFKAEGPDTAAKQALIDKLVAAGHLPPA
jgi:hypothetical protein